MWFILSLGSSTAVHELCGWFRWFFWTPSWLPLLQSVAPSLVSVIHGCFPQPWVPASPLVLSVFLYLLLKVWKCHGSQNITCRLDHILEIPSQAYSWEIPSAIFNLPPRTQTDSPELLGPFRHPTCSSHYHCPNSPIYPITWEKRGVGTDGKEKEKRQRTHQQKIKEQKEENVNLKRRKKREDKIRQSEACVTHRLSYKERKGTKIPSLPITDPIIFVALNKDGEGNNKGQKIAKKEVRCVLLVLFNFKD